MITLYGIKNCDTIKKARQWLETHNHPYRFHDFREDGLTAEQVKQWLGEFGWETLINKRSTSWKELDEQTRSQLNNTSAVAAILASPTLIKRPLMDYGKGKVLGFKPDNYASLLSPQ